MTKFTKNYLVKMLKQERNLIRKYHENIMRDYKVDIETINEIIYTLYYLEDEVMNKYFNENKNLTEYFNKINKELLINDNEKNA